MSRKCSPGEDKKEGGGSEKTGNPKLSEDSKTQTGAGDRDQVDAKEGNESSDTD